MDKSEQIKELATALSTAQGEMVSAIKDSDNPFFRSKYADLASVWEACRIPLSKNGLSVVQTTELIRQPDALPATILKTTLLHSSGQWISSDYLVKPVKEDPQSMGSAITYARRYALMAMVGIAPEDDDGESATGREKPTKPEPVKSKGQPEPDIATDAQRRKIFAAAKQMWGLGGEETNENLKKIIKEKFAIASTKELTKKQASELIEIIERGE